MSAIRTLIKGSPASFSGRVPAGASFRPRASGSERPDLRTPGRPAERETASPPSTLPAVPLRPPPGRRSPRPPPPAPAGPASGTLHAEGGAPGFAAPPPPASFPPPGQTASPVPGAARCGEPAGGWTRTVRAGRPPESSGSRAGAARAGATATQRVDGGPWYAGPRARGARSECSCGGGSHGSASAGDYAVEKFASSQSPPEKAGELYHAPGQRTRPAGTFRSGHALCSLMTAPFALQTRMPL